MEKLSLSLPENTLAQLSAAKESLETILKEALTALYLYGSAVQTGLRPSSDLDLLPVARNPLNATVRERLTKTLLELSGPVGDQHLRPLELTVISAKELCAAHFPPLNDYQFGEWLREEFEKGYYPEPRPDPDLTLLLATARAHAVSLTGPPAAQLLPVIARDELTAAIRASLPVLLQDFKGDERNVLLTLCRMLYTLDTGKFTSKDRAAVYAERSLPLPLASLLSEGREHYLGTRPALTPEFTAGAPALLKVLQERLESALARERTDPYAPRRVNSSFNCGRKR